MDHAKARSLLLRHADLLENARTLVHNQPRQFIEASDEIFDTEGVKILHTPVCK
jgi:hypothetical protein